jgi:phage protein D
MGGAKDGSALVKTSWNTIETVIVDKPIYTEEEAREIAKGKLYDRQLDLITGQGVSKGNPKIKAGLVIKIENVGERYSGMYYVTNALHMFHNGGYTTTFNFRRSGIGDGSGEVGQVVG